MDDESRVSALRAADELLSARYGQGRRMSALAALAAVDRATDPHFARRAAEAARVPVDEVLAALAQVAEARSHVDGMERRLIEAAVDRGASRQRIADALGLASGRRAEEPAERVGEPGQG